MQKLSGYAFPGNVRELENEVRRMVAVVEDGEFITIKHLSPEIATSVPRPGRFPGVGAAPHGASLKQAVEHLEAQLVLQSLTRHNWNNSRASRELGLSRVGLSNKIKRYSLSRHAAAEAFDAG